MIPASRLMRWNLKLLEHDFEFEHKPGKIHADADAVSRLVAALILPSPDGIVDRRPAQGVKYFDADRRAHFSKIVFYHPETMLA